MLIKLFCLLFICFPCLLLSSIIVVVALILLQAARNMTVACLFCPFLSCNCVRSLTLCLYHGSSLMLSIRFQALSFTCIRNRGRRSGCLCPCLIYASVHRSSSHICPSVFFRPLCFSSLITRSKKLLEAPGIATRSKDATSPWPYC